MRAQPIRSYLIRLCESLVSRLSSLVSVLLSLLLSGLSRFRLCLCSFPIVSYRTKCRILGLEVGAGEARSPCVSVVLRLRILWCLHRLVSDCG